MNHLTIDCEASGNDKPRMVAVMGPTAVGKTSLGIELAECFGGEIVSADSMQVYRDMDIGTAKPTSEQIERVQHHLIDVLEPTQRFSAGKFKKLARTAVQDIWERQLLPIIVGGTSLYIRVLLYDFPLAEIPRDPELRQKLRQKAKTKGRQSLHRDLIEIDPQRAEEIHPNDLKRVIRALEVYELTDKPMSRWHRQTPDCPVYDALKIGLWLQRDLLYQRIDDRVDEMFRGGLVHEVENLLNEYGELSETAVQALGYSEVLSYLQGELDPDECRELIKQNTRNFAKRQLTWLRKDDDITWIDLSEISFREAVYKARCILLEWW